jgi:hypothetical protein
LTIIGLDLFTNSVTIRVDSNPQTFTLNMGDTVRVDLDNDKISDVSIKFVNLFVNRTELTVKSLLALATPAETTPSGAIQKFIFKRNLSTGMIHADVKELQKFLNANGFTLAKAGSAGSVGHETTKFGAATRAAVIKFQKAKKITPAIGYFGPVTRGVVNAF